MSNNDSNPKSVAAAALKLVEVLTPLNSEERQRALISAMAIFGDTPPTAKSLGLASHKEHDLNLETVANGICPKALVWMKKNSITREELDHVFSMDENSIDIIAAEMPGKSKREQTVQAYIICGVGTFIRTGETTFTDKDARTLCIKIGAYDQANHSKSIKELGNFVTGTKDSGWKITNPGLSEGAKIIKELTSTAGA